MEYLCSVLRALTPPSSGGWLYNYQTLITGFIAIGAAIVAFLATRAQIKQIERQISIQLISDLEKDQAVILTLLYRLFDNRQTIELYGAGIKSPKKLLEDSDDPTVRKNAARVGGFVLTRTEDALQAINREVRNLSLLLSRFPDVAEPVGEVQSISRLLAREIGMVIVTHRHVARVGNTLAGDALKDVFRTIGHLNEARTRAILKCVERIEKLNAEIGKLRQGLSEPSLPIIVPKAVTQAETDI